MRKSFESPCPMNTQPRSTRARSFLYTIFRGVRVCGDKCGSRSPTRQTVSECSRLGESTPTFDTRPLCQVIDNHLARVDMIINKWHPSFWTVSTKNRHSGQTESCGAYHFLCAIRPEFCLLLLHRYKFRIDGHQHSCPRKFVWMKKVVLDATNVAIAKKRFSFLAGVTRSVNIQRDVAVSAEH